MPQLEKSEQEVIALARQFEGLKLNPAWQKLRAALTQFQNQALERVEGCLSSNAQVRSNLFTAYQERKKTIEFLDAYLANISMARQQLIRDLAELNGHYGEAAENVLESLQVIGD